MKVLVLATLAMGAATFSGRAALVYYANFESYTTSGTSLSIATNLGGAPDTFTSKTAAGAFTAETSGNPFGTGNYALATTATTSSVALRQTTVPDFGSGEVRVLSLDMALSSTSLTTVTINPFFTNAAQATAVPYGSLTLTSGLGELRLTAVYNAGASAIALPGSLGSLAAGSGTFYYQNELGVYTSVGTAAITADATGFAFSFTTFAPGDAVVFDNIGFWSSASDTVGGTSVLALTPGTVVVPEPSIAAFLLGSLGSLLAFRRGRRTW